jgi:small subunit ribosomal protein S2
VKRCGAACLSSPSVGWVVRLTNFRTVRSRLARLEELEALRAGPELANYSKKMQSALAREYRKMYRNLNGLRLLNRLPECLVVFDPKKEKNAIREARSLGIATVAFIDTDCDPDLVDLPIPGNDDGIRSIELVARHLADAIAAAKNQVTAVASKDAKGDNQAAAKRRRLRRPVQAAAVAEKGD